MSQVELYDNSIDPLNHLESYKALILLQRASDALICIAFPITLKKITQIWYFELRSESIHSFDQLRQIFLVHYSKIL